MLVADPYAALTDGAIRAFSIGASGTVSGVPTELLARANELSNCPLECAIPSEAFVSHMARAAKPIAFAKPTRGVPGLLGEMS